MKCWYTSSRYGILNNSNPTSADIKSTCRVVNYRGSLFAVYITEGVGDHVSFIVKPSGAQWESPLDVGTESLSGAPDVFVFKDKLYVLSSGYHHPRELTVSPRLAVYDDLGGRFSVSDFSTQFAGVPSLVELNGHLYMFYKDLGSNIVLWKSTTDMTSWSEPQAVKVDGVYDLVTDLDPIAISYQGLIHLFSNSGSKEGTSLIKFDGGSAWTRARVFVEKSFSSTPGLAVHNGLLRIVFSGLITPQGDRALHQYCYDGNSLSARDVSLNLGAKFAVSMAVQDGLLYVLYHGKN